MIKLTIANKEEFKKSLIQNSSIILKEQSDDFLQRCLDFLIFRYERLPYPLKVNGEDVSKVPPSEIAKCLQIVDLGDGRKSIQIVSSNPDIELSARRYAFLTDGNNNPFNDLIQKIDAGANI